VEPLFSTRWIKKAADIFRSDKRLFSAPLVNLPSSPISATSEIIATDVEHVGSISETNRHVIEYIKDYYTQAKFPPGYAVLVTGLWGCGKTHLVKSIFKDETTGKPRIPHIYISLYGIDNSQQIDEQFFQQLHPILSSKGMKIASAVMRGLLKTTVKIDLGELGKSDAGISSQMPDINLPEYLNDAGTRIIIFDDLERCSMSIKDCLGYINSLVEHDEAKVIIVADETKITDNEYESVKEKLIGITLDVKPDFDEANKNFIKKLDTVAANLCEKWKSDLEFLFLQSQTNNLRILQQAMWQFERFTSSLETEYLANDEAIRTVLRVLFALSFELRTGRANEQQISEMEPTDRAFFSSDISTLGGQLRARYPEVDFSQTLVEYSVIAELLCKGRVNKEAILEGLKRHQYFAAPGEEPAWRVLWTLPRRNDHDEKKVVATVEKQFADREFIQDGEILQVVGLRLWLARIGVLPLSAQEVLNQGKQYVDDLRKTDKLSEIHPTKLDFRDLDMGWEGLGYREHDTAEFKEFKSYLNDAQIAVFHERLPEKAQELIDEMGRDVDAFLRNIATVPGSSNLYSSIPILANINPDQFVDRLLTLPPEQQRTAFIALNLRYEGGARESLRPEITWISEVIERLRSASGSMSPIAADHLRGVIDQVLSPIVKRSNPSTGKLP
jgi:hypothetical protein